MKIKFYGTRGSMPICDREFQEFGGNTSCILLTGDLGEVAILDAGSGIRNLGKDLVKSGHTQETIYIAFSHFHWDHIQGFPFFGPAYDPKRHFTISAIGRDAEAKDIRSIFAGQMQEDYFPVGMDQMGATFAFLQPADEIYRHDGSGTVVRSIKHNHPGGAYTYRFDHFGKSVVYCTDIEHGETLDPRIIEISRGADLLIHDAQYTPEQLKTRRGWGHSSWEQAIQVAEQAGVKKLALTHHDPDHTDEFLTQMEKECQQRFANCVLARERMEIVVGEA